MNAPSWFIVLVPAAVLLVIGLLVALLARRPLVGLAVAGIILLALFGLFFSAFSARSTPTAIRSVVVMPQSPTLRIEPTKPTEFEVVTELDPAAGAIASVGPATAPATRASKPWIDDWVNWANSNGRASHFLRVESPGPCVTEIEARDKALAAATEQLQPIVQSRLLLQIDQSRPQQLPMSISSLIPVVTAAALQSGQCIADQHLVRIDRPYGSLWTCYLLIDTSPLMIDPIVQRVYESSRAHAAAEMSKWLSLALLAGVILLLYAFLNTVTKGYFVWRLRAIVLLAAIAGVLFIAAIG